MPEKRLSLSNRGNASVKKSLWEFPVHVFAVSLKILDLSYNQLTFIPQSLCQLANLAELDLSKYVGCLF